MIERTIITGEEKSKYFIHNDRLAKEWEKLCVELNGTINGDVNGAILEFDLNFVINKVNIHVHYLRQKSNNQTGTLIDHGYLITKNTVVNFSPLTLNGNWKIVQCNGLQKKWLSIFNNLREVPYNKEYSFISKENINNPITQKQFSNIMSIAELRSIKNKEQKLTIVFFNALGTSSLMRLINIFITKR